MLNRIESTIAGDGTLTVALVEHPVPALARDEVLIRVEASPANPSDMSLMLGPITPDSLSVVESDDGPRLTGTVPADRLESVAARLDQAVAIGNEGAGTIVAAGSDVGDLVGRSCSGLLRGGMFGTLRVAKVSEVMLLPDDVLVADAASMYINPLTVLAMTETMRRDGHRAIIHTAAASNLGQMLVRACAADDIPLVNVVRRDQQADLLRGIGARHVVNASSPDFVAELHAALRETGATILFDALGGGSMADTILRAMEKVAASSAPGLSRYGSDVHKSAYIYSGLSDGPTTLARTYGQTWSIAPFFLPYVLSRLGPAAQHDMQARVLRELRTTFASHYTATISLEALFDVGMIQKITRRATGEKYLVAPQDIRFSSTRL